MKLLFIQTGGTIDKAYPSNENNHGYNFLIASPAFDRILRRGHPSFEIESMTLLQKDSTDITDDDRKMLYETCESSPLERIVITHGTDTILQTAEALRTLTDKTIVLTGAFIPEAFKQSDADFNVGTAVAGASSFDHGIYIAMSGRILDWKNCVYDTATGQFTSRS